MKTFIVICFMGIGFCMGNIFQIWIGTDQFKKQAVKHGAAEYVITNKETGATEFRWKEIK